jgi:antirestriction protein ArdC
MANGDSSTHVKQSTYEQITSRIVEQLEAGVAPWKKPWKTYAGQPTAPANLISQKPYRGINALLTLVAPFSSPWWLTFAQAQKIGGHVNAGEKSPPIVFWKFGQDETEDADGETISKRWAMCRLYHVFNLEQCTIPGLKIEPTLGTPDRTFNPIPECERIVAGWTGKPQVKHSGDRAFYHPSLDYVNMPARESFDSPEFYYSVLFHEMTHSTGHKSRLGREGITEAHFFGDPVYSREELVAEMGAAFISGHCGIVAKTLNNSASYLESWIRVLKSDSRLVLVAAGQAQKAADLILGKGQVEKPAPVAPVTSKPERPTKSPEQVSLAVGKFNCPYVTLKTVHGAMVIDRKRYLAALKGIQVLSATVKYQPADSKGVRVLEVAHSRGVMRFFNQLDVAEHDTRRIIRKWAEKEREKRAAARQGAAWKADSSVVEKWLGKRITWVPRDEERQNRITGLVVELIVNPTTGRKGCVIADDWNIRHKVWDKTGALYLPQDAPALPGPVDGQGVN